MSPVRIPAIASPTGICETGGFGDDTRTPAGENLSSVHPTVSNRLNLFERTARGPIIFIYRASHITLQTRDPFLFVHGTRGWDLHDRHKVAVQAA